MDALIWFAASRGRSSSSLQPIGQISGNRRSSSLRCAWTRQVLLEGGANPNAQNSDGRTPLHLCMPAGFSACVVHLYNAGAGKASFYSILSLLHPSPSSADQGARFADRSVRACASQYIVARSVASQVKVTLRPSIVAPFPASYSLGPQMTQSRTGTERQRWTRRPRISRPRTFEEGSQGEREILLGGKCGERPLVQPSSKAERNYKLHCITKKSTTFPWSRGRWGKRGLGKDRVEEF